MVAQRAATRQGKPTIRELIAYYQSKGIRFSVTADGFLALSGAEPSPWDKHVIRSSGPMIVNQLRAPSCPTCGQILALIETEPAIEWPAYWCVACRPLTLRPEVGHGG